jgi:hypothetical protein
MVMEDGKEGRFTGVIGDGEAKAALLIAPKTRQWP